MGYSMGSFTQAFIRRLWGVSDVEHVYQNPRSAGGPYVVVQQVLDWDEQRVRVAIQGKASFQGGTRDVQTEVRLNKLAAGHLIKSLCAAYTAEFSHSGSIEDSLMEQLGMLKVPGATDKPSHPSNAKDQ